MGRYVTFSIALAVVLAIGVWWTGPTGDEVATSAENASRTNGPMVDVVLPETLSANAEIGKLAYDAKCAVCHGANAAGQDGVAPPLVHKIYEPSHHGDAAFLLAAKNGVRAHHWRFGNMPPVEGVTDGDVKMIIVYVRELQRANGIN
ncbi:Cytochrome C oxidase, cbb3-type, subunit III [Shimia marina]|jgi:mono/diheme cytochrome c family protein|uniref:Cytochrome c553 n=3 Tax=Rhodobacterales TaxID=204455 RepID=A0A2I7KFV6_9RHOB|nr:Cytochrome c553 [Phaeobacter inhibens]CUH51768.1 putative bifunctional cbb3-type cytochrome c oxidase subunit II/cytochrome c [Shimia marina]SFE25718.1 Cytochrome C oxidase, cbb3-type, subunit III [Shimia marina]